MDKPKAEGSKEDDITKARIQNIKDEQDRRRKEWEEEDRKRITELERELAQRRHQRELEELYRWESIEKSIHFREGQEFVRTAQNNQQTRRLKLQDQGKEEVN